MQQAQGVGIMLAKRNTTLLPRLISGQLRLSNAQKELSDAIQ